MKLGQHATGRLVLALIACAIAFLPLRMLLATAVDLRAHELIVNMNYPHAMQLFARAQWMDPNLADAVRMQLFLARLAPEADARAAIARSANYLDRHPDGLMLEYRAFAWQHLRDEASAARDLARAADAAPDDWKILEMAAKSEQRTGAVEAARRHFVRVLELKPGWPPAVKGLRALS